jgi:hypothetical protein
MALDVLPTTIKPLLSLFSQSYKSLVALCQISAIKALKTRDVRFTPLLLEDKSLKHELFGIKTNVMLPVTWPLTFSGSIAADPMIPPLLEDWPFA